MFRLVSLIYLLLIGLHASAIEVDEKFESQFVLKDARVSISEHYDPRPDLDSFKSYSKEHINLGFAADKTIWVMFELKNTSDKKLSKRLVLDNPLLGSITLFDTHAMEMIKRIGLLHFPETQIYLYPSFRLEMEPHSSKHLLLRVENKTTALQFSVCLKNEIVFQKKSQEHLLMVSIFLGIILSLFITNLFLSFFLKDKSYAIYALYLFAVLYQQITYLGVTPLLFDANFVEFDNNIVVFKVNMMIILASLFAITFLKTSNYKRIDKIYKWIILVAFIEMPLIGLPSFYWPEVSILTGLFFIIFNLLSALYIYTQGYKQARFFVFAWSVLVIGFLLMIFDALGWISVMYYLPNFIMIATALEAILLSFAFTDRYVILRKQKESLDVQMLLEAQERERIISDEISRQTEVVRGALEEKKVLLKELQHRTKNNLQLILSIVRMQEDNAQNDMIKERFKQLESRIRAISKTHEILYLNDEFAYIEMYSYIYELSEEMQEGYDGDDFSIEIKVDHIRIPLREAIYIGLIINELVTNSIKYAQCEGEKKIKISLVQDDAFIELRVGDNGQGYDAQLLDGNTLGLSLVKTLVEIQLEGEMLVQNRDEVCVKIRFKL